MHGKKAVVVIAVWKIVDKAGKKQEKGRKIPFKVYRNIRLALVKKVLLARYGIYKVEAWLLQKSNLHSGSKMFGMGGLFLK